MKFYLCNGQREKCGRSSICRVPGGCWHTSDIFYALYDEHDQFEYTYHKNEEPDAWEIEGHDSVPICKPKKNKR